MVNKGIYTIQPLCRIKINILYSVKRLNTEDATTIPNRNLLNHLKHISKY